MKKQSFRKNAFDVSRIYVLLICLSYGFTGANFILSSICNNQNDSYYKVSIMLGIVMLCMIPVSWFDKRKEMRGKMYVVVCCVMHVMLSIWIAYFNSSWRIMILYAVEVIVYFGIVFYNIKTHRHKERTPRTRGRLMRK